jgi:hypothetical protein
MPDARGVADFAHSCGSLLLPPMMSPSRVAAPLFSLPSPMMPLSTAMQLQPSSTTTSPTTHRHTIRILRANSCRF